MQRPSRERQRKESRERKAKRIGYRENCYHRTNHLLSTIDFDPSSSSPSSSLLCPFSFALLLFSFALFYPFSFALLYPFSSALSPLLFSSALLCLSPFPLLFSLLLCPFSAIFSISASISASNISFFPLDPINCNRFRSSIKKPLLHFERPSIPIRFRHETGAGAGIGLHLVGGASCLPICQPRQMVSSPSPHS